MAQAGTAGVPDILAIKQVAHYLQVNERMIYRLAVANSIPASRSQALGVCRKADIEHWMAERSRLPEDPK